MNYYEIDPVDTLFFRDGRPYNMGETQNNVKSIFPPSPYTITGALRAQLARQLGWTGKGNWPQEICDKLGDGRKLGSLNFNGPYLQADGELIFPMPRNVLAQKVEGEKNKWAGFRKLKPGDPVESDIGPIRYPTFENDPEKMKNINGYLSTENMTKVLSGDNIDDLEPIPQEDVWKYEFSVGIQRDDNLTVKEGGLFSRSFIRLGNKTTLVSGIDGIEDVINEPLMLGGEAKAAFVSKMDGFALPEPPDENLKEVIVVLITPAKLKLKVGEAIEGLPEHVKLVSICADRPQMIGGWDHKKGPLPLKPHLKAGSVLFCESEEGINPSELNGKMIGENNEFGFGQILIGRW